MFTLKIERKNIFDENFCEGESFGGQFRQTRPGFKYLDQPGFRPNHLSRELILVTFILNKNFDFELLNSKNYIGFFKLRMM